MPDGCNGFRLMNLGPPSIVVIMIGLPYYVYVRINCKIYLDDDAPGPTFGYLCLGVINTLMFFLIWSFVQSIMVDPGRVPEWYARLEMERQGMHIPGKFLDINPEDKAKLEETLQAMGDATVEKKIDGSGRWCRKCVRVKPDRCHHCRVCQRCVLKMDHHCPWINNCVGHYNYKYFYLFIVYALMTLFWVVASSYINFLKSIASDDVLTPGSESFCIVLCWMFCMMFSIALGGFVTFHTYLLLSNFSTIELVEKKGSLRGQKYVHPWDNGYESNIQDCLGEHKIFWMIPARIGMRGNGCRFKASEQYREMISAEGKAEKPV